jgi:NAD(P)-dependent dehydrogenase (short-subunit alcohol dehydrogenase family)
VASDMGRVETIPALIDTVVQGLGPIDILVNNAGTTWAQPTAEHTLDGWNKVLALNLTAIFVACQEVGKRCMLPRKSGRVINIASIQGLSGGYPEGMPTIAYNASKGGVVNLTRMLAKEWAPHGILVNAIAPGYFESKMTQHIFETQHDKTADLAPLGRTGGPEELKGVTALLASDAGGFITGQIIAVDGGLTAVF